MKAELELMQGEREESRTDLDKVRNLLELCTGELMHSPTTYADLILFIDIVVIFTFPLNPYCIGAGLIPICDKHLSYCFLS